jgi:hypothetical protein
VPEFVRVNVSTVSDGTSAAVCNFGVQGVQHTFDMAEGVPFL